MQRWNKKAIESTWASQNRDVDAQYGTRQSGSGYMKQRSHLFMENRIIAQDRTEGSKNKLLIEVINCLFSDFYRAHEVRSDYTRRRKLPKSKYFLI